MRYDRQRYYNTDRHIDYNGTLQDSPGDRSAAIGRETAAADPTRDGGNQNRICCARSSYPFSRVTTPIPG